MIKKDVREDTSLKLAGKDIDIEVLLPTGKKLLLQYREETGLVDICFEPTGLTVWQGEDVTGSLSSGEAWQLCVGVHRDEEAKDLEALLAEAAQYETETPEGEVLI